MLLSPGDPKAVKGWDFPLAVAAFRKDGGAQIYQRYILVANQYSET